MKLIVKYVAQVSVRKKSTNVRGN